MYNYYGDGLGTTSRIGHRHRIGSGRQTKAILGICTTHPKVGVRRRAPHYGQVNRAIDPTKASYRCRKTAQSNIRRFQNFKGFGSRAATGIGYRHGENTGSQIGQIRGHCAIAPYIGVDWRTTAYAQVNRTVPRTIARNVGDHSSQHDRSRFANGDRSRSHTAAAVGDNYAIATSG